MKPFTICYLLEFSGDSATGGTDNVLMAKSIEEILTVALEAIADSFDSNTEQLKIKVGQVSCSEAKDITKHQCILKIELNPLIAQKMTTIDE